MHGSPQPPKQKPGIDTALCGNDLWRSLLFNRVKLRHTWETHKDPGRNTELKWVKTTKWKAAPWSDSHSSSDRKEADGSTQMQITATFYEKRKRIPGDGARSPEGKMRNQGESVNTDDYFQTLKPKGICPVGFLNCYQPVSTFHLPFSLWNGNFSN